MTAFITMTTSPIHQPQILLVTLFGLAFFPNNKFSHGCVDNGLLFSNSTITTTQLPCVGYNYTPQYHPYHAINPHHVPHSSIYGHRTGYYGFQNIHRPSGHHHPDPYHYRPQNQLPERLNFPYNNYNNYRPPTVTSNPYYNQLPPPPVPAHHPPVPARGSYSYPPEYTGLSYHLHPNNHYGSVNSISQPQPYLPHPHGQDIGRYVPHHLPHSYPHHPNHIHSQYHLPPGGFHRRTYIPTSAATHQPHEPVFLGRGGFGIIDGKDAELVCSFNHPQYRIVSNVAWVRVEGPYVFPHFDCQHHNPGQECKYHYINQHQDFRFRVISSGFTSTLRIYDYTAIDYGIYRCAATGQGPDGKTSTLYQVIEFVYPNPHTPLTGYG